MIRPNRPLDQVLNDISTVLASVVVSGLSDRFDDRVRKMRYAIERLSPAAGPWAYCRALQQLWVSLAQLITWAHVPPGIYRDGQNNAQRELWLTQLEVFLAELIVAIDELQG